MALCESVGTFNAAGDIMLNFEALVGGCRLTLSKRVLKAPLVSGLDATI